MGREVKRRTNRNVEGEEDGEQKDRNRTTKKTGKGKIF